MSETPLHIRPGGPSWPAELDTIDAPPTELWLRGETELLARRPRVAIVGSRSPTPYGEAQAERFARRLAAEGVTIVSGLARGIDAIAHGAALDMDGVTVAVLASGVDRPWPAERLTERIARSGVFLSEYSPGTPPRRHHFPLRNRLISGLSEAVVVIEAAYASGSLITARWAADQGRSVFALPGRVDHPMARGCHRLLREGAELAESPEEVLAELGWCAAPGAGEPAEEEPCELVRELEGETLSVDELSARLATAPADLLARLVQLELDGRVVRSPGGLYRRVVR